MDKRNTARSRLTAIAMCCLVCCCVAGAVLSGCASWGTSKTTVGFIYDNDESTPYSYNFFLAEEAVQKAYGDRVNTVMYSNVLEEDIGTPVDKLVGGGCDIIFTNCYGDMLSLAERYPNVQFCQVSNDPYPDDLARSNYHTFKGEVYQGRYVSGVVAGLKLREMIENRKITADQAKVGFVGAFPYPEVISGYTAFILGVRSVVPQATLRVKYTETWSSYTLEKACATELLDEGCVVISQHSDTVGPAIACEECYSREVYHVAYNIDMTDVAPNTSLVGTRINWSPYVLGAVRAVMEGKSIENTVEGRVHPKNDMSAGFENDWVKLTKTNEKLLPSGVQQEIDEVIAELNDGSRLVFSGDYLGVNPADPNDTIDLRNGFVENEDSSIPTFHYILQDVVFEEQ